jgi:signal transduction histidine kinase
VHVETTIRPAYLDGDPLLIERMVTNLVDNAAQHNIPGGRVEITTGTEQGCAVLTVANTGQVIPPGEVDRLFQPFQRLDARRIHYTNGHGLGLSIVRSSASLERPGRRCGSRPSSWAARRFTAGSGGAG